MIQFPHFPKEHKQIFVLLIIFLNYLIDKNKMASEKNVFPDSLSEITASLEKIELLQREQQNALNVTQAEIRSLKKSLQKYVKKEQKSNKRRGKRGKKTGDELDDSEKKPRKPCGFQLPTSISDEMCDFIGCAKGVSIPRTEITKFITKYISENKLQNPEKRKFIIPDAKLTALLGPESVGQEITHFTIHRYLKRHFPPSKKSMLKEEVVTVV
jgi:chromatin remodeling complex protein RSC6